MTVDTPVGRFKIDLIAKVDTLKPGQWWEWSCDVTKPDGTTHEAFIQSDGHMVAFETLVYA